jgi:hypothetical protein
MNMSNIKNMNINIINQLPIQSGVGNNYMMQGNLNNEELISNFSKLNMRNETAYGQKSKKDMAYNYYFGQPDGESNNIGVNYDNLGIPVPMQNFNEEPIYGYESPNFLNQISNNQNNFFDNRIGINSSQQMNMDSQHKGKYINEKNNYNREFSNKGFTNKGFNNKGNGFNNRNKYSSGNNSDLSNNIK